LLQEALRREAQKRERERALLLEAQELRRQAVRQERERSAPELAQHIRCAYARLAAQLTVWSCPTS
jgi:PHD/YefM family antitoxin component YafN of YafNO toxin-antitoxin module